MPGLSSMTKPCGGVPDRHVSLVLRRCFADQDHVGIGVAPQDSQALAVQRPVKVHNLVGAEIRDLAGGATLERLHQQVVHAILADGKCDRLSVGREAQAAAGDAFIRLYQLRRGSRTAQIQDRNLVFWIRVGTVATMYARNLPSGETAIPLPVERVFATALPGSISGLPDPSSGTRQTCDAASK